MSFLFRCKRDLGQWSYTRGRSHIGEFAIFSRVRDEENDAVRRSAASREASGIREDVSAPGDWCGCDVGCCVGFDAVFAGGKRGRAYGVTAGEKGASPWPLSPGKTKGNGRA